MELVTRPVGRSGFVLTGSYDMSEETLAWRTGRWRGRVTRGWEGVELADLVAGDVPIGHNNNDQVLKRDARSLVVRTRLEGVDVVCKQETDPSPGKRLKRQFFPPRAVRAWRAAGLVARLGIATPQPVACLERRCGPLRGQSWLITRHIPGADARTYLTDPAISGVEQRRVVTAIVTIYLRLHANGVMHADNRPQNFVICGDNVFLLDLDLTTRVPWWSGVRQRYLRRDWRRLLLRWRHYPQITALFRDVMGEQGVPMPE